MYNGIIEDTRSLQEKDRDFDAKELLVTSVPLFRNVNDISEAKMGTLRNQDGSGSCVCQSLAKAIEMSLRKQNSVDVISALYAYQNRSNRPQSGSSPVEMCQFTRDNNWYLERDVPSQNMDDQHLDEIKIAKEILKNLGYKLYYFIDNTPNFEEVAQYIEEYGNAMLLIDSDYVGYCKDIPTPKERNHQIRHEICAVDNITLNNEKYIVIDDSWGITGSSDIANRGQRLLTKDAFNQMVEQVIVIRILKEELHMIDYSKYQDIKKANFGDRNANVIRIQEMLKEGGYLNKEIQTVNYDSKGNRYGYYGTITSNAVLKWQLDVIKSVSIFQLKQWAGKYFGTLSLNIIKIKAGNPASNNMKQEIKFKLDKFLPIAISGFLMYLASNWQTITWTEAGLATFGTGILTFLLQALAKYISNQENVV